MKLLLLGSFLFNEGKISREEKHLLKDLTIRRDASLLSVLRAFELMNEDFAELEENLHLICAEYERTGQEEWFASHEQHNDAEWRSVPEPVVSSLRPTATPTFSAFATTTHGGSVGYRAFSTATTTIPTTSSGAGEGMLRYLTEPGWKNALAEEFEKPYFKEIIRFVDQERRSSTEIFPTEEEVFNAFNYTPLNQVKVVILGQDPYFNPGQAHGLCFSVKRGVPVPPSLGTIYKELEATVPGFKRPTHGYLEEWARQGVLMLNATLTVRHKEPNSHAKCGWQTFSDAVINVLNREREGIVYLLWGAFAQKRGNLVDRSKHTILEAAHPSPMAIKGFIGCGHFTSANDILKAQGQQPIDWRLSP